MSKFTIYKDNAGEYRVRFDDGEGNVWTSDGFANKESCHHLIDVVRRNCADAPVEDDA